MNSVQVPLLGAASSRPILINTGEAAERLSVTKSCLVSWRRSGGGPPYFKIGASIRYAEADVDAFLAAAHRTA